MSRQRMRLIVLSTLLFGVVAAVPTHDRLAASVRDSAGGAFTERVADYARLRQHLLAQLPQSGLEDDISDPETRHALAFALQKARQHAHPGDVFGLEDVWRILRIVRVNLSTRESLDRQAIFAEVPLMGRARINEFYPESAPLATVPPLLLAQLAPLPPTLQYRFLGDALILLDVDTNLIVDVIPNALGRRST